MDAVETNGESALVRLTHLELVIIANAINEAREALEPWEFATRMGAEIPEVEHFRGAIKAVLAAVRSANPK